MKYVVYLLAAAAVCWAAVTVWNHLRRTFSGQSCDGDCKSCQSCQGSCGCSRKPKKKQP